MTQQTTRTEQERLGALIEEYRSEGFDVLVQPSRAQLPEFLQTVQPDLVASKGDEHIVVEVRSRSTLRDEALAPFVRAVEGRPGWTFELVLVNSPESDVFGDSYRTLDSDQLRGILDQAEAKSQADSRYAALLVWVAIEGVLAERLSRIEGVVPNRGPKRLIKEALSLGLIAPEERELLDHLAEFRNRFVHAINTEAFPQTEFESMVRIARSLLDSRESLN